MKIGRQHFCSAEDVDTNERGWRPCPPDLCQAETLLDIVRGLKQELEERHACLVGARDDLAAIQHAAVEDGGLWLRSVAERRQELVEQAIVETDKALVVVADV